MKTLKDLEIDVGNIKQSVLIVYPEKLRQEAIKWVKNKDLHIDNWRTAFKKFFNIKMGDLK